MTKLTPFKEDKDSLEQVAAMLSPLQGKLSNACSSSVLVSNFLSGKPVRKQSEVFHRWDRNQSHLSWYPRLTSLFLRYGPGRQSRQQSLGQLGQLQQSISGWEGKDIVANCSEIVFEGKLKVIVTME